jgi:hypothetical protein
MVDRNFYRGVIARICELNLLAKNLLGDLRCCGAWPIKCHQRSKTNKLIVNFRRN